MQEIEQHPLTPFLPSNARILLLGSFPPPKSRWSIDFFYPNFQNDMWRIMGIIFYADKNHFVIETERKFDREKIIAFCNEIGLAIYDTASEVNRLNGNASDKFLEVVKPTDLADLLAQIPQCEAIVTTGEKATDTIVEQFGCQKPKVGSCEMVEIDGKKYHFYRMPSSSRAYPLPIGKKADAYRILFERMSGNRHLS